MLFLPSDYPEAGKNWHPTTKALVKAAKRYGLINTDRTTSGIGMNAVNPAQFQEYILGGENPYHQLGISEDYNEWLYRIWNGTAKNAAGVNWDPFPFEALQVMQKDYAVPDSASVTDPVRAIATEVLPSVRRRTNQSIDYLRGRAAKTAKDVEQNTKTLIPDGPITITETAEGIKIGAALLNMPATPAADSVVTITADGVVGTMPKSSLDTGAGATATVTSTKGSL